MKKQGNERAYNSNTPSTKSRVPGGQRGWASVEKPADLPSSRKISIPDYPNVQQTKWHTKI